MSSADANTTSGDAPLIEKWDNLLAGLVGGLLTLLGTVVLGFIYGEANDIQQQSADWQGQRVMQTQYTNTLDMLERQNATLVAEMDRKRQEQQRQREANQATIRDLQERVSAVSDELERTKDKRLRDIDRQEELEDKVRAFEDEVVSLRNALSDANRNNERKDREIERLQQRVEQLEQQLSGGT